MRTCSVRRDGVRCLRRDGTFTRKLTAWDQPETDWGGYTLRVADVTGDGAADLIWNLLGESNRTYVVRSNRNGTFDRILTDWKM